MNELKILFCTLVLFGCKINDDSYALEEKILNCFYGQYEESGIDIEASIDSANNILLKYHILPENSAKSHIQLIEAINKADGFPFDTSNDLIKELESIKYLPRGIQCTDMTRIDFDSTEYANSKLKDLARVFDLITAKGNISVAMITEELLKVLDEKDFEHPYYRTLGILNLSNLIKVNALSSLNISKPGNYPSPSDQIVLTIRLTANDEIIVKDKTLSKSEALQEISNFISKNQDRHVISVNSKRETSYDFFSLILDSLDDIYFEVRNKYSEQNFQKPYNQLEEAEKDEVKRKIPKSISIAEPEK